jgi:alpha-L-fucosidase
MTKLTILIVGMAVAGNLMAKDTYTADWESLAKHEAAPEWLKDAKLGIYFHWGVYSVPAFNSEWYPHHMHIPDHKVHKYHLKTYGDPAEFGYHDFLSDFTGEHFDPEEWAELFQKAGARFAGPVAEHHDGFAMWDSKLTPWNAKAMGPKRDVLGDLSRRWKNAT